jgi:hypothetical protein
MGICQEEFLFSLSRSFFGELVGRNENVCAEVLERFRIRAYEKFCLLCALCFSSGCAAAIRAGYFGCD